MRGVGAHVFERFRLDPYRRSLTHDGAPVPLRPILFDVLLHLVEHPGRIVGKDELLAAVWPERVVEEANLSQAVFWLRAALREAGGEDPAALIHTARGRGYRFMGDVRWEPAADAVASPAGQGPESTGAGVPPLSRSRRPVYAVVAFIAALALVAGLAGWRLWGRPASSALKNTVVLADFQNRTPDAVFDHTLASVLRIDLGQSPYVEVMADKQARDTLALMTLPPDARLTMPLAQEVCTRGNADAVLEGALDAIGPRYLLTLIATDCSGRRSLAAEKADVIGRENVVPALDRLIVRLRRRLGEPVASVDRFNVPLAAEKTSSLDALKAFSEGLWLADHGRRAEAVPTLRHAVELDPKFAAAYASLAVIYGGTNEDALAATAIGDAYRLRNALNEREKLRVATLYHQLFERDLNATVRTLQVWTTEYPNDAKAWSNLANVHNVLGQYGEAVDVARHAVALHPPLEAPYVVLARAYLRSGRPDQARAIGAMAVKQGLAGDATHGVLLAAALMQGDQAGVQRETAWARGKPGERVLLVIEGQVAYGQGRIRAGDALFDQSAELSRQQGLPDFARAYRARLLNDLGLPDRARTLLATVADTDDDDLIFTLAEIGDPARAEALLSDQMRRYPSGTLIAVDFAPEVRAALALRRNKPLEAIAALQPAFPYQSRTFDIPYLAGRAYLAAGDGARAERTFRLILDHRGWYPESPLYALATLGLARALKLQHSLKASQQACQSVLTAIRTADPTLGVITAAERKADDRQSQLNCTSS